VFGGFAGEFIGNTAQMEWTAIGAEQSALADRLLSGARGST